MKFKTPSLLLIGLLFSIGYLTSVIAVTDAELQVLEKQLEKQEAEEKKQVEIETKRKEEQKRKLEIEAKKKRLIELEKQRQEDQRKKDEEKKRLANIERQRHEEEAKNKAEHEKKEKYNSLITEAEQALNNKDKELAIKLYKKALTIIPNDSVANTGLREAEKLKHKLCYEILGPWLHNGKLNFDLKDDGTLVSAHIGQSTWICSQPENRTIELKSVVGPMTAVLSADSQCLHATLWGTASVFHRSGHKCN